METDEKYKVKRINKRLINDNKIIKCKLITILKNPDWLPFIKEKVEIVNMIKLEAYFFFNQYILTQINNDLFSFDKNTLERSVLFVLNNHSSIRNKDGIEKIIIKESYKFCYCNNNNNHPHNEGIQKLWLGRDYCGGLNMKHKLEKILENKDLGLYKRGKEPTIMKISQPLGWQASDKRSQTENKLKLNDLSRKIHFMISVITDRIIMDNRFIKTIIKPSNIKSFN